MSERTDHRDSWADDLAAYALGSLDERRAALIEQHVSGCESCAAELRWLMPAVDVIPASVEQHPPPPELRERLMAIVNEEAAAAAEPASSPRRRRLRLPGFGAISLRPAMAGVAAAVLLVAGIVGYEISNETTSSGPDSQTYAAASQVAGSHATGTLEVSGDEGSLHVVGLPPIRRNEVYQAWVQEPAGAEGKQVIHPSSVFVVSNEGSGDVSIPSGLEGAARVMVTREPKGGSKLPSESPVLTAEIG